MEVHHQLQQLLSAAHSQPQHGWTPFEPAASSAAFDLSAFQLQLMLLSQQQNCTSPCLVSALSDPTPEKPVRSGSLQLPAGGASDRQPFRDLHAEVYGINTPQTPSLYSSKPSSTSISRSLSSSGGRWTAAADQRDVLITDQLALIKSLNDTITKQKQEAVEHDAVRSALEATITNLRKQQQQTSPYSAAATSRPNSPPNSASTSHSSNLADNESPSSDCAYPSEAQVAYWRRHAETWSHKSQVDRQQLIQVLRTLIASNKRYQQPLPPMCVKPECRCRNCWFLHAQIDETAWAAAWELHMSLR